MDLFAEVEVQFKLLENQCLGLHLQNPSAVQPLRPMPVAVLGSSLRKSVVEEREGWVRAPSRGISGRFYRSLPVTRLNPERDCAHPFSRRGEPYRDYCTSPSLLPYSSCEVSPEKGRRKTVRKIIDI